MVLPAWPVYCQVNVPGRKLRYGNGGEPVVPYIVNYDRWWYFLFFFAVCVCWFAWAWWFGFVCVYLFVFSSGTFFLRSLLTIQKNEN